MSCRYASLVVLCMWLLPFFTAPSFGSEPSGSDLSRAALIKSMKSNESGALLQKILDRGVLRVAMHKKDHSPYFMTTETGEIVGIDADLAREIAEQLGVKLQFIRTENTFNDVVKLVQDGKADIAISKLSLTLTRAKNVLYTKSYSSLAKSIIVNRRQLLKVGEQKSIHEIFSEKGAKIGAIAGSSYVNFARRIFPNAEIYESSDWYGDIIPKVFKGELWGAFRDEIEVRRTIFLTEDASLYVLAVNLEDEQDPFMMIVNKNAFMLRDWLDLFLDYIYKPVDFSEALEKYKSYVFKKVEGE